LSGPRLYWVREGRWRPGWPPVEQACDDPNGLLAAGGDLEPTTLLDAYRRGIFPWFSEGDPILWWSPQPRAVLRPQDFVPARSLRRRLARGDYRVSFDTSFDAVVAACAAPRLGASGTWITPAMSGAYGALHRLVMHTAWRPGRTASWSAACMAWRWGRCFLASPCSAGAPMPPRWRLRIWCGICWIMTAG
jgi:leucyl/phenylalanyl-tRNA--protein transferase